MLTDGGENIETFTCKEVNKSRGFDSFKRAYQGVLQATNISFNIYESPGDIQEN